MLTMAQRKRLAREARKLAMECVTNGPEMNAGSWCGCAAGIVVKRAGLAGKTMRRHIMTAVDVDAFLLDEDGCIGLVSIAVMERTHKGNPTAVVFPLLALADALEGK